MKLRRKLLVFSLILKNNLNILNIFKFKMPTLNNNLIKLSTVANFWWYGFILAIFIIMIFNLIAQHVDGEYYKKVFCNSLL
jgi:type II secretory pathway component PulF